LLNKALYFYKVWLNMRQVIISLSLNNVNYSCQ